MNPDLSFSTHMERLRAQLSGALPGTEAQLSMAPETRGDRTLLNVAGKPCREAAVLMLLFPMEDTPALVLTERPGHLAQHAGQVAFPGGRREPGESLEQTALREAHEEVGLDPTQVDVLGGLTPLYVPPSNFCVYPFVAAAYQVPDLRPSDEEVAAVLQVPLPHLLAPATRLREEWTLRGRTLSVPFYGFDAYQIWGATAMMLAELLALFE